MTKVKMIGFVLGIVLGIVVALIPPPAALTVKAMWGLGIFVWAIIFLIFDVLPDFIVTTTMLCLWVLFGTVPFKTAFAFFSDANWWIVVGAFGLGFAASKSGLLRRISLLIMKALPATFKGQVAALMGAGFVIAPLIPSFTAKATVCSPLSLGISDAMGYKHKSRGAAGLFGANVLGFIASAPAYLSASYLSYMIVSLLPKDIQGQFHWMQWFILMLPWTILLIVAGYLSIILLYKPEEKDTLPAGYAAEQLVKMGPMSRNERITLIILVVTLLFWMTEKLHGVPAAVVAVLAVVLLMILKVYDRVEFRSGIAWDALVFLGGVVGIGSVFPALKLDKWMGDLVAPYVMSLVSNPYVFVLGLSIIIMLLRLVILSQTATIAIFILMLTPLVMKVGMSPWIVAIIVYAAGNTWTLFFQNTPYVGAFYATGGNFINHNQMVKLSVAYMAICIVGLLICVPLWQIMGLIK